MFGNISNNFLQNFSYLCKLSIFIFIFKCGTDHFNFIGSVKNLLPNEPLFYRIQNPEGGHPVFVCKVCSYTAYQKISLKRHVRTHTGERPFVCPTCGNAFRLKHHLKNHLLLHEKCS